MAPAYGIPNYDFTSKDDWNTSGEWSGEGSADNGPSGLTGVTFYYMIALLSMLLLWLVLFFCLRIIALRQKTRNPQQRRMYVGNRPRQSLASQEPTIYVSPSNLPPPPKYEYMAPPSYEEVVGVHYPNYQIQPISQPINAALAQAQTSSNTVQNVSSVTDNETSPPVSVTVTNEPRRTSVTIARS